MAAAAAVAAETAPVSPAIAVVDLASRLGSSCRVSRLPTWMRRANSRATLPSRVKQLTPLPNSWSLMICTAVAKSGTRTQLSTGPKISSL